MHFVTVCSRVSESYCSYQEGHRDKNTGSGSWSLADKFLQCPSQHFCNTAYLYFKGLDLNNSIRMGVDLGRTRQNVSSFIQSPSVFCRDRGNPRKKTLGRGDWSEITSPRVLECYLEISANESEKYFPLSNFIDLHERDVFMRYCFLKLLI